MSSNWDGVPTEALEDVAYLSRSANRVVILEALTEGPVSRREIEGRTDTSRTTLDRIVNELEDRGWAERTTDGDYVATPIGSRLMAQFRPFLESVATIRTLEGAVTWLPDDLSIGLHHFSDATVQRPSQDDPLETIDYFVALARGATDIRILTHLASPEPLTRAMRDGLASRQLAATYVVTTDVLDYLRDQPDRRDRWLDILDHGAEIYRYEGQIPCNLFVFDDQVLVKKSRPGSIQESYGVPIVSENGTVRSWARDLIERYRADATRVDVGSFDDAPVVPESGPDSAR